MQSANTVDVDQSVFDEPCGGGLHGTSVVGLNRSDDSRGHQTCSDVGPVPVDLHGVDAAFVEVDVGSAPVGAVHNL